MTILCVCGRGVYYFFRYYRDVSFSLTIISEILSLEHISHDFVIVSDFQKKFVLFLTFSLTLIYYEKKHDPIIVSRCPCAYSLSPSTRCLYSRRPDLVRRDISQVQGAVSHGLFGRRDSALPGAHSQRE